MRWTTRSIAACWLFASAGAACGPRGGAASPEPITPPSAPSPVVSRCLECHPSSASLLQGPMATREAERAFVRRAFGEEGDRFFAQSCAACHVASCEDCHGQTPHGAAGRPEDETCGRCHHGYFVGWDYHGRAPREDHARYQRGPRDHGETYLEMLPDIHAASGMRCVDCHTLHASPEGAAPRDRRCRDCHPRPSDDVPEHAIAAHMERMRCVGCHAAWTAQEYGTFLVRGRSEEQQEAFAPLPRWGGWRKSALLKRQDAPPLGLDAAGLVAPIRPQFILFATDTERDWENRLLVAEWRAFTPHTVRRGTVTCGGCHEAPRRYLLEADQERLYELEKDGLPLRSFWSREGQVVVNGSFLPEARHQRMNRKTSEYVRQHLRQWQNLLDRAERPSAR